MFVRYFGPPGLTGLPAELRAIVETSRRAFIGVALMSGVVNVLYLTGSFFMLEVYDRVLPSRSVPTLLALCLLALTLYSFQGALELIRGRVLARIGVSIEEALNARAFDILVRTSVGGSSNTTVQPLRDLDQVRGFCGGLGPTALFDLPWIPIYLAICFLFHPAIGLTAVMGATLLVAITVRMELRSRAPAREAAAQAAIRYNFAEASRRNAEVLHAMNMRSRLFAVWDQSNRTYLDRQLRTSDLAGRYGSLSKVARMVLQSAVLAIGAYLVIEQKATGGIIIASSILTARALAPIELAIAHWKSFMAARVSWSRLAELFAKLPQEPVPLALPRPRQSLSVEDVSVLAPSSRKLVLSNASFSLMAGEAVGVIGPSASGKSCLVRALSGVWEIARGEIRLDGAALDQWSTAALGDHIGYLPQDVELFSGSVAQNIARFDPAATPEEIVAAGEASGAHEMILRLPNGYETQIGEAGSVLSAGQRQRVALARALFRDPFLIILDEPNSNLDNNGEGALTDAILRVKARGGIVIVVAHRPSALRAVDYVLAIADGRVQSFGRRDDVLRRVLKTVPTSDPLSRLPLGSTPARSLGDPSPVVAVS